MKIINSAVALKADRVVTARGDGNLYHISHYFTGQIDGGLQVFLVDFRKPHGVIRPHFHVVEQYQVVMSGGGTIGKHPFDPMAVHYVDRFSPYGPIVAGIDGISYFTLRVQSDPGAKYMPESRKSKVEPTRRNLAWHPNGEVLPDRQVGSEVVIPKQEDHLEATHHRLAPNAATRASSPAGGGGQFLLVARGGLVHEGVYLPAWSCIYVAPNDDPQQLMAGGEGADVFVLGYPVGALRTVGGTV